MTAGRMSGPERRREAFVGERRTGGEIGGVGAAGLVAEPTEAMARLDRLAEYRQSLQAAGPAGLTAVPGGLNWVPIGPIAVLGGQAASRPVVSGRVQDIAVSSDGRRVYVAAANGGVWRSTDAGRTWEPMSDENDLDPVRRQVDSLATGAIALVEGADAAHDRLYVGTGEGHTSLDVGRATDFFGVGMLLSTDGGATWQQDASSPSLLGRGVYALAVDPSDPTHALAATTAGVYRRRDRPDPWQQEALPGIPNDKVTSVAVGRLGGSTVFFAVSAGFTDAPNPNIEPRVFRWTAAAGWTELTGFVTTVHRTTLAASTSDPPVLYALTARLSDGKFSGVHRCDLGAGATPPWDTVANGPEDLFGGGDHFQGSYDQALAVDPNDGNIVYAGGSTVSVGGEWSAAIYRLPVRPKSGGGFETDPVLIGGSVHADVHALVHRPGSSDELWAGCDGGIFRTTNAKGSGDRLFESRNVGLATLTLMGLDHHPSEESFAFCGAQDNGGLRYLGGEVWDHQLPGDGGDTVIDWNTGARLLSGYTSGDVRRAATDGSRYSSSSVGPPIGSEGILFYPPITGAPPSTSPPDASVVAVGAERPWVSRDFGDGWTGLPARPAPPPPPPPGTPPAPAKVRSLAFAGPDRLWAGWGDGHVARYDLSAGGWTKTDFPRAGENRPVTGIAVDPADASGQSIYVTLGGALGGAGRLWHLDSAPSPPSWTDRSGAAGQQLLDVQHNAVVVHPNQHQTLFAGADLGVWRSDDAGAHWANLSNNLPDAAVLDIDLLPGIGNAPNDGLLRVATYGRGVWEAVLTPTPEVELLVRANALDQRRRPARKDATLPGARSRTSRLDESPDIVVDPPGSDGRYALDPARLPDQAELLARVGARTVLASVPDAPATTRVYVTVRNRGVRPTNPAIDGVRVALLVGPAGDGDDDAPAELPAGYAAAARDGTAVDADGWKTVGIHTLDGVRLGRPSVVAFELRSDLLPVAGEAGGKRFALLALLHHADDPFPADASTDPIALVTSERRAALRRVVAEAASGAATAPVGGEAGAGGPKNPVGGTGLVVPVTAALLAHQRIGDIADQLERKVLSKRVSPGFGGFTRPVAVHPVERRVLAMAQGARDALRGGPPAPVPRHLPGAAIGSYALLGALGFELAGFTSVLAPGGAWVADAMRRGTPDPHRSLVKVPSTEFPLALAGKIVKDAAAPDATKEAARGFAVGMLAAAAAGVTVGPQLADLLAAETHRDWHRHSASAGAAALERHLRRSFLGGDAGPSTLAQWLPPAADVPAAVWDAYLVALADVYHLPADRVRGFPSFESAFDAGDPVTATRLRNAYGLVLDDLRTSSWPWPAWWGLLTPILLAPSFAMLIGRELPHARAFFEDGASVDERSVFELLTIAMGLGSLAPFVYSMILWGAVDEHTEAFVTALVMFLARAGLVAGGLGTSGDDDQGAVARWLGFFSPLVSLDVYAAIRAIVAGSRRPGVSTVFALQTIPALTGLATLGVTALLKALGISHDWPFWLAWTLHTLGVWLGVGIPVAIALSNGGGWRSWFLRDDRRFPLLSSVGATAALPSEPVARARVFGATALWSDPTATAPVDVADLAYPSGMRPLVRLWWEGDGPLEVRHDADLVVLRRGAVETPVRVPPGSTAASLAQRLVAALDGVHAEVVAEGAPDPPLPWPRTLADPGDDGPIVDAVVARTRFVPVGTSASAAVVLRHAPRADLSTPAGLLAGDAGAFPVIPAAGLGDLEASGLGAAADLAALLAIAAAPALDAVTVVDGVTPALADPSVGEVVQVFRRWNLDERRVEEWQALVTGGAPDEGAPAAAPDPLLRTPPGGYAGAQPVGGDLVAAMGWLPLWRAWLRMAGDPAADAAAPFALATTPLVHFPDGAVRRPTNAQLTEGVRFLLDLGAA